MEFVRLYCHIPHEDNKPAPLCDVEAGIPITIRCTCSKEHVAGHTNKTEFSIDTFGNVVQREIDDSVHSDTDYNDEISIGG